MIKACKLNRDVPLFHAGCLSILEHVAEPSLVANCSAAVLRCRLDTSGPNLEVWWTFHGENASKLPNVVLVPPPSRNATSVGNLTSPVTTTPATTATTTAASTSTAATGANATQTTPAPPSSSSPVTSTAEASLDDVTTVSDDVGDNAAATTTVSPAALSTTVSSSGGSEATDEEAADDESVWTLRLNCPTLEHAGSYACYALSRNASEFIYKKEASLDVYVPVSVEVEQSVVEAEANSSVTLTCLATGHPAVTTLLWSRAPDDAAAANGTGHSNSSSVIINNNNATSSDASLKRETNVTQISEVTYQAQLTLESLRREDNGTYVCYAANEYNVTMALQDVLVLESPEVNLSSLKAEDARTAKLSWRVRHSGNQPVSRYHLQVRNYSTEADWLDVHNAVPPNMTSYLVHYLAPGATYGFRLAAVNSVGNGPWEQRNITMPPDVPPKINQVHLLATTNETLVFAWRRPSHDNGANISQYNLELFRPGQTHRNQTTLSAEPQNRLKHMYVYVGLTPGEQYVFQMRACNIIGCGNWSDQLDVSTADGMAGAPQNVEMHCFANPEMNMTYSVITWEPPEDARGTILGYKVSLEGHAFFRRETGLFDTERLKEPHEVNSTTHKYTLTIKPNTNYTVRICTVNKAGCGNLSGVTAKSTCTSPPIGPAQLPKFNLQKMEREKRQQQLKLHLKRVSERNGNILCYRVIVVKLARGETLESLPKDQRQLNITSYQEVHKGNSNGAYIAEAISSDKFVEEVVLGDDRNRVCSAESALRSPSFSTEDARLWRGVTENPAHNTSETPPSASTFETEYVRDGALAANTNYTGFVQVHVRGSNGTLLSQQSPYFAPVETGADRNHITAESPAAIVFGVICGLVLVALMMVIIVCIMKKKNGQLYEGQGERLGLTALLRRTIQKNGHVPRGKRGSFAASPNTISISADNLPTAFIKRHCDSDLLFQSEFEMLPERFRDRMTVASDAPENLHKNRYPDIKAFDQTRVKLTAIDGIPGSDYINANFVEGFGGKKMFICAQGPLDRTVTDFWRMIWEHRVSVIVMLTGIEENGKVKCAQYWSDDGTKEIEKQYTVRVMTTKKYSDYIVRRFFVEHTEGGIAEEREMLQFHFTMWKDFLAPEQPSWLLRFIKRVNEHYVSDRGPLLVHCSAGVGRTGTFVAIDSLLEELEKTEEVDIFSCVSSLRKQRNFLVQSLKQYIFIYRALLEHAQFGDTEIEIQHLRDHYLQLKEKLGNSEKTGMVLEFEKLGDVIEDPKTCCVGMMDMNVGKNRYDFIVPYDFNRVILPVSPSRDHSSYINASFVQGYDRSLSFIITQDPLDCTVVEFWRMIKEQCISTIVMLSELGEGQTKCQQYWPSDGELMCDYVKVKFVSQDVGNHFIRREFDVINVKQGDSHRTTQLQYLGWVGQPVMDADSTASVLCLVECAQQGQMQHPNSGPITVHCSGGGDRSSVFVTLSVLIQQLKAEERVDVFQAARYTRSQRHCMLQTPNQYEFLYRGLLTYIESHNLCNMGDTQL
ncbi:tyrosine-protein phosphatase 69D [Ixodes scapularis]|uniref:tyrosine-protein phosphatase 69D n=1 Tax=Ixodes scapularis TaxID=6945 RepID=UPI001C38EB2E|nr:tyrosine-protein phosphatase 69D [Ixodes scapularis]